MNLTALRAASVVWPRGADDRSGDH